MASRRGRPTEARRSGMASGRQWQVSGRWAANGEQTVNSSADPCADVMCASICRRSDGAARRREDGKWVDAGQQMMGLDGKRADGEQQH